MSIVSPDFLEFGPRRIKVGELAVMPKPISLGACRAPENNESYDTLKREVLRAGRIVAVLWIAYWSVACIAIFTLPFYIGQERVPGLLRPLWNSQSLVFVLMVPFIVILRFSRFGRRTIANIPLENAVLSFEKAQKEYKLWQQRQDKRHLKRSHDFILGGQEQLQRVPKFQDWREKISAEYEHYFGEG